MTERGSGNIKSIVVLAAVVYAILFAVKMVPVWTGDKEIVQKTAEILKYAGTNRWDIKDMAYQISLKTKELDIPVDAEQIIVTDEGNRYHATMTYERKVNLIFYTYQRSVKVDQYADKY